MEEYNGRINVIKDTMIFVVTSDHDYFERTGEEETKRFFETA